MIADWILKLLGEDPEVYPHLNDKWPAIFGIVSSYIVPYGMILTFLLPFVVVAILKRKFTLRGSLIALAIGILLAISAYLFDQWLLDYGQAAVFWAINDG